MDWSATALSYLAGVTVRSLGLVLVALVAIGVLRVSAAAARHAVWTVTLAGMLLLAALAPVMPPLPLRVLSAPADRIDLALPVGDVVAASGNVPGKIAGNAQAGALAAVTWPQAAMWIYLAGLAVFLIRLMAGYILTSRLVRASRAIPDAWAHETYEANWISVPLTVGWLRPKILLPTGWREWDAGKLQAVLVHERTHVRRGDWAIALLAGVNRCLFWFHPAAWWLERQLAALAEQSCDDAALLEMGQRESYAQALLDMAAAVKSGEGRLVWEAMAMAKASEVRMRIDRILDESRQIPRGVSRLRWAALAVCSLPLIYLAAALQLAPALAQQQPMSASQAALSARPDFATMEAYVASHPDDLQARGNLIRDYYLYSIKQPRLNHIYWMIQNHPESLLTGLNAAGILPRTSALNDAQDYQTAASLWRTQVSVHAGDPQVLANAARFFGQPGGDMNEAERLLVSARSLERNSNLYTQQLARLYATAIITNANDPAYPTGPGDPIFAATVKSELEASDDASLLSQVASLLTAIGRTPNPFGANAIDLNAHPAMAAIVTLGNELTARAQSFGMRPGMLAAPPRRPDSAENFVAMARAKATETTEPKPPVPQRIRVGGNVQRSKLQFSVDPVYPQAARDAGIEGTVELAIVISKEGKVQSIQVTDGHPLLAAAAQQAVSQWVYSPTLLNGDPVEVVTTVSVPFRLQ